MDEAIVAAINDLIQLDRAAVLAYGLALKACTRGDLEDGLVLFKEEHERHVHELSEWLRSHGEEPAEEPDRRGEIIREYTSLSIAGQGDRGAMLVMRSNEELTNHIYWSALRGDLRLPADVRQIIEKSFDDERRHLAWLRETIEANRMDAEPAERGQALRRAA